ncbi:DUF418 domain-containing protein [Qipengyuania sp. RANM35]|uniref:DUF418 domain-containing protein n=1 Tax=Qipengyuania sp. RANM35 TaxID=3068635 RepID=UPI0034DABC80
MEELRGTLAAPVAQNERIDEIDVLRGFALSGVLIANFVGFAGGGLMATDAQLDALATARIDHIADLGVEWLVANKANTLFATLFGLGFYIQISRNGDRPGFTRRYSRRLFWLLVFGVLNFLFLWVWDILNLYAIGGFLLLLVRKWRTKHLVVVGLALALMSNAILQYLAETAGVSLMDWDPYSDAAVIERQTLSLAGDYLGLVAHFWRYTWDEWFAGGIFFAWIAYAGGRMMLGAAIGRSGIVSDLKSATPLLRRLRNILLPAGLLASFAFVMLESDVFPLSNDATDALVAVLESPCALLLAAGYATMIVVAWQSPTGKALLTPFRPVGQMALTNYLMQGFAYGFILFGVGPGLALGGKIGIFAVVLICLAFFAFQMAFSAWWLARYRFGPMEWLWRWLTYGGSAPAMRRLAPAQAAT